MSAPRTIIVADDDPLLRQLLDTFLRSFDYQITLAADGEELVRLALHAPPALVITDLAMPVLDGPAAIRRLRHEECTLGVPIIAISAQMDGDELAFSAGADAFLLKPFSLDALLTAVLSLTQT
jgi:CheY-like chemotaxis protein